METLEIDKDFLHEYGDVIRKYIWSKALEGREEYDNLYNDVIIKLLENKDKYDPDRGAVSTWITWVMRTTVFNYFRDKQKDALHNSLPLQPEDMAGYARSRDPSEQENARSIVCKAPGLLKNERELLIAYYHLGYSEAELAPWLGIAEGAVRKRIQRVKDKLTKQVQQELENA